MCSLNLTESKFGFFSIDTRDEAASAFTPQAQLKFKVDPEIHASLDFSGERICSLTMLYQLLLIDKVFMYNIILQNFDIFSMELTNAGCCGVGRNNGHITCLPGQAPCLSRNEYVFWDAFHPGEAANIVIGRRSFRREAASDAHPYDIQQLASL